MHIPTIAAFVLLFWRAELNDQWLLLPRGDLLGTLGLAVGLPTLLGIAAMLGARRVRRLLKTNPQSPSVAQRAHHRAMFLWRVVAVAGFGTLVLLTPWPSWFALDAIHPALQIIGDCIILSPYFLSVIVLWIATYSAETLLRPPALPSSPDGCHSQTQKAACPSSGPPGTSVGMPNLEHRRFRDYLDFQIRHHLLIIAVPLTLILFAANMANGYRAPLEAWTGWPWASDAVLGVVAVAMFIAAPVLLRHIWRTHPLEPGPVRERLEALSRRIGLSVREILVWHSDGLMVNAAVMGLFAPVRFVLLSDTLLRTMSVEQIEAVFGHEAGHVRHRHIQYFLVFAFVGWLVVAGIMEALARTMTDPSGEVGASRLVIQGIGVVAMIAFWGLGFGWLSRRFERQADLFGAECAAPPSSRCHTPCSVHPDERTTLDPGRRVCATGVAVFASALDRVASLNGIPQEERSWRHSSIGSRIRFLVRLAGDPGAAVDFQRRIQRIKIVMVAIAVAGSALSIVYGLLVYSPGYAPG